MKTFMHVKIKDLFQIKLSSPVRFEIGWSFSLASSSMELAIKYKNKSQTATACRAAGTARLAGPRAARTPRPVGATWAMHRRGRSPSGPSATGQLIQVLLCVLNGEIGAQALEQLDLLVLAIAATFDEP